MRQIEDFISPLIEQQFPSFYQEEGQLFITFVKAYYEWAEKNLQLITLENPNNFLKGDTITQGDRTGTILATFNGFYLIELNQDEIFKCNTFCNELTIATSSSGGSSFISTVRQFNHEFLSRNLPKYRDIDTTIDKFIIEFKNKYLPDVQFNTESNKRLFIKNALDFYRAKGTERAVDLFFKLIYGFEADVYYPGDDVFKLSDNEFINVQYLELIPSETNVQLVGQTIVGSNSGASAFVERLVRVRKGSRYIEVIYLASVVGDFQTGEQITSLYLTRNVTSKILGSLSFAEVTTGSDGFQIGDILSIEDGAGKKGKLKVTDITQTTGFINFELIEKGWGFSSNAIILSSERVIQLNDLTLENENWYYDSNPFRRFETVQQDLISFTANTQSNTDIIPSSQTVFCYDGNTVIFEGTVVSSSVINGTIIVNYDSSVYSNSDIVLSTDELYTEGNTLSMFIDQSQSFFANATGNVIATSDKMRLVSDNGFDISFGDVLYQINDRGIEYANCFVDFTSSNNITGLYNLDVERLSGVFRTNRPFYKRSSDKVYNLNQIANTKIGIIDVENIFYENAVTYGKELGTKSKGRSFSYEVPASFAISNFRDTQSFTNFYANDIIESANLSQVINSTSYGLSGNTSLGFNDVIADALSYENVTLGAVDIIIPTSAGESYSEDPFFVIYEPKSLHLERYDYVIEYTGQEQNFRAGEIIQGSNSGALGYITEHDGNERIIYATRLNLANNLSTEDDFIKGENITSFDTNITTTITYVNERRNRNRTGLNANVFSDALNNVGFIRSLEVIDSGFGYNQNETVTARSERDSTKTILAKLFLGKQGVGQGYFVNRKGFLSSDKYLHDNDYYQEFSYEVLTSLPFEIYKKTLIDVLHVSGTKPFGKYVGTNVSRPEFNVRSIYNETDYMFPPLLENVNQFLEHEIYHSIKTSLITNTSEFFVANLVSQ